LKRSVGSVYEDAFDFEAMSDILGSSFVNGAVPDKRRRRIRAALSALKSQKFFEVDGGGAHNFVFDRPTRALEAFYERLPEMVDLIKAMTIARLEIEGRYKEETHDAFFRRFDERFVEPDDLGRFPSYLVCLRNGADAKTEKAMLTEVLSSGLPMKVLVQSDDILEDASIMSARFSLGVRGAQLAAMAVGLNNAFVLQSSGSALYRMRDSILGGLKNGQPALFSIFSGLAGASPGPVRNTPETPPYLRAAAALESRAFPAFVFDPARGDDWASRFSIDENPQAGSEWPVHHFCYEDDNLQKISEDIAFTFVDFAAVDGRFGENFADVPRSEWQGAMVPVDTFLKLDAKAAAEKVPYILMIDENNTLHKVIVDVTLLEAAHRCRKMWRNLQELGGVDNSHARNLLAKEKGLWEQEKEKERNLEALRSHSVPVPATSAPEQTAPVPVDTEQDDEPAPAPSGEPYIETPRCTTCDECTQINNRMFAYDDNKQAFIADPDAGTFRQLVEAAESCQVAIIHPGKPKNPDEPNLDEIMARAEAFN
ncbi:MAG: ferredoxin, partial [Rhodospirillales bacterium]|nr:ferredoxin [Rhodospirillales bacterium]